MLDLENLEFWSYSPRFDILFEKRAFGNQNDTLVTVNKFYVEQVCSIIQKEQTYQSSYL